MLGVFVADLGILGTLGKVSGVAGIALGLVAVIFREVIRKQIFPKLDNNQAFRLLRLIIVLAGFLGLAGLGTWAYALWIDRIRSPIQEEVLSGIVRDEDGKEISDAEVTALVHNAPQVQDRTTTSGLFRLTMSNVGTSIRVVVTKDGYARWEERVSIPQSELRIILKSTEKARKPKAVPPPSDKPAPLAVNTSPPAWEQISADVKKNYTGVNVVGIAKFGTLQCDVKSDGKYCRQPAHVTLQSADETRRCYAVVAGYKLVRNEWLFDGVATEGEGCSD